MRSSRRQLIAAAGLAALAGCGGAEERPRPAADLAVLGGLLELERGNVAFYAAAERAASGRERELLRALHTHETEHAFALEQAIRDLGADPGRAEPDRPSAPAGNPLRAAVAREGREIRMQSRALGFLRSSDLRALVSAMLVAEGTHEAALLDLIEQDENA